MASLQTPRLISPLFLLLFVAFACGDDSQTGVDGGAADSGMDGATDIFVGADALDGGMPDGVPAFRPGTRLFVQTFGGVPTSFIDSELDMECEFRETEDGTRCVPTHTENVLFQDSACEMPVLALSECDGFLEGDWAIRRIDTGEGLGCGNIVAKAIRIGAPLPVEEIFVAGPEGSCEGQAVQPTVSVHAFEDVPESSFVSATREVTNLSEGAAVQHLHGEDGSSITETLIDRGFGVSCHIFNDELTARCIPDSGGRNFTYGRSLFTADCSEALGYEVGCRPEGYPDIAVARTFPTECGGVYAVGVIRTGAEVPIADVVSATTQDTCAENTVAPSSNQRYFRVTEPVPDEELIEVSRIMVGTGRVRSYWWSLDGAVPRIPHQLLYFDSESDLDCKPFQIAGEFRCIPLDAGAVSASPYQFSDPACSSPALTVYETEECAAVVPALVRQRSAPTDSCGPTTHRFFEVAPGPALETIYEDRDGACVVGTPREDSVYFALGTEVPVGRFPLVEIEEVR